MHSASVAILLNAKGTHVLYMKRTEHPLDRHSGQVCFPGGMLEPIQDKNSMFHCCLRECQEEIGISLQGDDTKFQFVGKLEATTLLGNVKVHPFIFQLRTSCSEEELTYTLQESEVAGIRWCNINEMYTNVSKVPYELMNMIPFLSNTNIRSRRIIQFLLLALGLPNQYIYFPSILLKSSTNETITSNTNKANHHDDWHLWGLTKFLTGELIKHKYVTFVDTTTNNTNNLQIFQYDDPNSITFDNGYNFIFTVLFRVTLYILQKNILLKINKKYQMILSLFIASSTWLSIYFTLIYAAYFYAATNNNTHPTNNILGNDL